MLPESVDVLGKRYKITHEPRGCGGSVAFGDSDHGSLTIGIRADQAEGQKRDTLLHEIIHAVDFAMHTDMEERQVHAMAAGLLCVLRGNAPLVDWLMREDGND